MKKVLSLILATVLVLSLTACQSGSEPASTTADYKVGQVQFVGSGSRSFAVGTVVLNGDKIIVAHIDEFQFLAADNYTLVPNSDSDFGANYKEADPAIGLASKRVNNEAYSAMMAERAGATLEYAENLDIIQNFAIGKTIAELEAVVAGKTSQEVLDAISGATFTSADSYLKGIIEAAKAAK